MYRRAVVGFAAVLFGSVAACFADIETEVDLLLSSGRLAGSGCKTAYVVMDAASGSVIASGGLSADADSQLIPASNMKLLSSGAALAVLGADYEYETELRYDKATNTVIAVGSGDPAFGDPKLLAAAQLDPDDVLNRWVEAMQEAGVPAGAELVIDDRVFDRERVHPSWPREQLNRWYCCEVAGLNFHTNYVSLFTKPTAPGESPGTRLEPEAGWIDVRNKARTVTTGKHTAWAARQYQTNKITLNGNVRWSTDPVEVTLHDSPSHFALLLADRMGRAGIKPAVARMAGLDEELPAGELIHVERTPIQVVMDRCNKDSYNLYAECLLKGIGGKITGGPGSWQNGAAVLRMVLLEQLGTATGQGIVVADGSGMSRENRVTPRLIAEWLCAIYQDSKLRDAFIASLPLAGEEGTLRKRFKKIELGCEVRAKTGYLTGISSISGYVVHPQTGRTMVFSIITNEKPNKTPLSWVRQFEERVVDLIDDELMPDGAGDPSRRTVSAPN